MLSAQVVALPKLQAQIRAVGSKQPLPIFQLPQIQAGQYANRKSSLQLEVEDDVVFVANHLKLSSDVVRLFEVELGITRHSRSARKTPVSQTRSSKTAQTSSSRRPQRLKTVRSQGDVREPLNNSAALRAELLKSLYAMSSFSTAVKQDIAQIQRMVPITQPKSKMFAKVLAVDKLVALTKHLYLRLMKSRFYTWQHMANEERKAYQRKLFIKYQALRRLIILLNRWVGSCLYPRFLAWSLFTRRETERLRRILDRSCAIEIQKIARGWLVRLKVARLRARAGYEEKYDATLKIQAFFRGRIARFAFLGIRRRHVRLLAAGNIQRVARGYLGRLAARRAFLQKHKALAATIIQSCVRGVFGRRIAKRVYMRTVQKSSSIKIQRAARAWLARRVVGRLRHRKLEEQAAVVLQKYARRWLCKRRITQIAAARAQEHARHTKAAAIVQRIYRGHRARMRHKVVILQHRAQVRRRMNAVLTIQCFARCRQARKVVLSLKIHRLSRWIEDAKQVKEMWSEDSNAWFYYNDETGEATWEPPEQGYTKSDEKLVLFNGLVTDNPQGILDDLLSQQVEVVARPDEVLCSECNKRLAIRACMQCEDKFCTKCFRETHTGRRGGHSYQELGPVECSECEEVLAIRWCIPCDDAFCDICWRKLHTKGKRRMHPFSEVAPNGTISNSIVTIDGKEVTYYDPALYAQGDAPNITEYQNLNTGVLDGSQQTAQEWIQYVDENQYTYYYNQYTGESTYEYPY